MTAQGTQPDPYAVPERVPRQGGRFVRGFCRALLHTAGWRIQGTLPNLSKFVIIGGPHTSNWDFPLTIGIIFGLGIDVSWMGKHTFVDGPFGRILRAMGGVAVDRRASSGVVGQMVAEFEQRQHFILALSPEGTRSKVKRWKTGFYHMANGAGVPIVPIAVDYPDKLVVIMQPFMPSGDLEVELPKIQQMYAGFRGKKPDKF